MTIRAVSLAAQRYAEVLEKLREADDAEDRARRAADDLAHHKERAADFRKVLESVIAEARKANEIP